MNKKGQATDRLSEVAIGILVVAITLIVAFLFLAEGKQQVIDRASSQSFSNVTETITVDQFVSLDGNCIIESSLSVNEVYNGTQGNGSPDSVGNDNFVRLLAANFTIQNNLINVSNDNLGLGGLASSVNISYSCPTKSNAYNATVTMQNATSEIPGWVGLIVLAAIALVILGLVQLFRRKG